LITPELDQYDHEDQSLQAIEEPARIIDAIKIFANIDEGFIEEVGFYLCIVQKVGLTLVPMAKSSSWLSL
jgi:hypothetical protein